MSESTDRTIWDQVNEILDEHAVVQSPAEWDALRRAIVKAEAARPSEPPAVAEALRPYRGDAADRLAEVYRFIREHGDHHLRRFEGDEEFGYEDGLACDTHEVEFQFLAATASPQAEPEHTEGQGEVCDPSCPHWGWS